MRRLIAVLILIAALGAPARPQSALPSWDDSWVGVHSLYTFDPTDQAGHGMEPPVTTCPQLAAIAFRYDFGWGGGCRPEVKAANPGFINSLYRDGTQSGQLLGWHQMNHPDWILYLPDRVTPLISYGYSPSPFLYNANASAVIPDFTNPAVRDYRWQNEIGPFANTTSDALGFDNVLLCNDYAPNPLSVNGEYGHALGNYPNATPSNLQAPPFNVKFVGSGCYADVLDPPFTDAHIAWLAYLRDQIHALATPKLVVSNSSPMPIYNDAGRRAAYLNAVDGIFVEGGNLAPEWVGDSRKLWLGQIRFIEQANSLGKAVYILQVAQGATTNSAITPAWIRFTLASYLLGKGHQAAVGIVTDLGYKNTYWPAREFDAANGGVGVTNAMGVGAPCGPMTQAAGPIGTEDGLFVREHSGGISAVNASGATSRPLTLPSGSWIWRDLYDNIVTSPINMAPRTGYVFLKSGITTDLACSVGSIDTTPPLITAGPTVDQITEAAARINGQTNEPTTWRVDYGLTASYGTTASDPALAPTHALTISPLTASTTYHYRVTACDASVNCATSTDQTFNTLASSTLMVLTSALPGGTVGTLYNAPLQASGGAPSLGFARKVPVTLPRPASTLANFPHWICKTFSEWKTVPNAGLMVNDQGLDLIWYADTALTTRLDFVKYRYSPTTGEWCGMVRIPSFPSTADTVIWAAYANTAISTNLGSATATFSPAGGHIRAHWSMDSFADSTTMPTDLVPSPTAPASILQKVNNGLAFGFGIWAQTGPNAKLTMTGAHTLCMWVNYVDAIDEALFATVGDGGNYGLYAAQDTPGIPKYFVTKSGALRLAASTSARNTGADVFLCGGHNGANVVLYVNGSSEVVVGPAVALPLDVDPSPAMVFGQVASHGAHWCTSCKIDEATLYDEWVGADWINARYAAENAPTSVSLGPPEAAAGGGYTWTIASGTLPAGLALMGNAIRGVPTTAGTSNFTVRVSDGVGTSDKPLSIAIAIPITITQTLLPNGVINGSYNQLLTAQGGTPPFVFTLRTGVLPPGLAITSSGIQTQLNGTLRTMGFYVFGIRATDAVGATQDIRYQMFVGSVTNIQYSPLLVSWNFASGTVNVKLSDDCNIWTTIATALPATATPYMAPLPQSPTACLRLESSTELNVTAPAINISGLYVR